MGGGRSYESVQHSVGPAAPGPQGWAMGIFSQVIEEEDVQEEE